MLRILLSVRLGEKRWTQKQLADATGIRRNTINDLYHEMTDRVSLEQLDLICKALDCKISDLLVQEEDLDDLTRSRLATPRCRWAGWKAAGYMVEHGAKALFQAVLIHSSKGDGQTYRASFFGASQVKQLPSD